MFQRRHCGMTGQFLCCTILGVINLKSSYIKYLISDSDVCSGCLNRRWSKQPIPGLEQLQLLNRFDLVPFILGGGDSAVYFVILLFHQLFHCLFLLDTHSLSSWVWVTTWVYSKCWHTPYVCLASIVHFCTIRKVSITGSGWSGAEIILLWNDGPPQ